jgi:uncharacterized SAM-binding protein YcdF (DUF218 family)
VLKTFLRRLVVVLVVGSVLLLVAYVFRAPLLSGLAEAWVVNEPTPKADAIVVLGGSPENRPFEAAKLYHEGVAPVILYTDVQPSPAEELGIVPTEPEQTRRILASNGVPDSAMILVGTNVANTFDEAVAVRDWVGRTGTRSVVIVTDWFHTRRARWIFQREFRGHNEVIYVVVARPAHQGVQDWWRDEYGIISFQNEILKYVYYRAKY